MEGQLARGGELQVLALKAHKRFDTRHWKDLGTTKMPMHKTFEVEWLDIDQVEAPEDDLHQRGYTKGAARFTQGEGMRFGDNEVCFACTNGSEIGSGQVFRYVLGQYEGTVRE